MSTEYGNWTIGKHHSQVVSDLKVQNTNFLSPPNPDQSRDEDLEYYGGYLICESIGNSEHAKLITAAPDLLLALEAILPHAEILINANHPDHKRAVEAIQKARAEPIK